MVKQSSSNNNNNNSNKALLPKTYALMNIYKCICIFIVKITTIIILLFSINL